MNCSFYKSFSDLHSKSKGPITFGKVTIKFYSRGKEKIRKMSYWTTFGKAFWKIGKFVLAAFSGFELHDAIAKPTIVAVPQPFPTKLSQGDNDDNLNAAEIMVLGWSGLALLAAILLVFIIFKCISLVRYKPES